MCVLISLLIILVAISLCFGIILHKTKKLCNFTVNVFLNPKKLDDLKDANAIFKVGTTLSFFYDDADLHADPFLFVEGDYLYLFMEEAYLGEKLHGNIKAYRTKDLHRWENLGVIYKTDCHLSYPFVFKDEGSIYMIPETGDKKQIQLLKAERFPFNWKKERILLEGEKYLDSHLIKKDNLWYLFTNPTEDSLHIYISEHLYGQWKAHPGNPVVKGEKIARSGGSIINTPNGLFRIGQDCSGRYGSNIGVFKITALTPNIYEEEEYITKVHTEHYQWNKIGGHHLNMVHFKGNSIVVMDGLSPMSLLNRCIFYLIYILKVRMRIGHKNQ